jgi:hypothetical protein
MERVPIPEDIVAFIKMIVNVDRRERHAAGYKLGSIKLAHRIAAELGLKLETVRKIKERKRRRNVPAARLMQCTTTRDREVLEQIRQRRIRSGCVGASWRGDRPDLCGGRWSYRKRLLMPR